MEDKREMILEFLSLEMVYLVVHNSDGLWMSDVEEENRRLGNMERMEAVIVDVGGKMAERGEKNRGLIEETTDWIQKQYDMERLRR